MNKQYICYDFINEQLFAVCTGVVHSSRGLSYDGSTVSSKGSAPQRTILCFAFNFLHPSVSLRSSSSCLYPISRLPVSSILPYIFPSIACLRTQFLYKMPPVRLVFPFIICRIFLSFLTLCNTSSFLSRSIQLIFSILLQHDT
jgi:hypothetical protein